MNKLEYMAHIFLLPLLLGDRSGLLQQALAYSPQTSRRSFLGETSTKALASVLVIPSLPAIASDGSAVDSAEITNKIYIDFQGLPANLNDSTYLQETDRIVIGLFGKEAPNSVNQILQIASPTGFPAECKPKEIRLLEREQLESNKVYNTCRASMDIGVNYDLSSVWRIVKNDRIDVGAVAGRFVARESPLFDDKVGSLKHNFPGVVSVRRGSDGGFGFTIW